MNIQIQAIHFSPDVQLKSFINKMINKLMLVDANITSAEVFLKLSKPASFDNKIVEMKLHSTSFRYFAKKQTNSFEESADLATQALRTQIIKQKKK